MLPHRRLHTIHTLWFYDLTGCFQISLTFPWAQLIYVLPKTHPRLIQSLNSTSLHCAPHSAPSTHHSVIHLFISCCTCHSTDRLTENNCSAVKAVQVVQKCVYVREASAFLYTYASYSKFKIVYCNECGFWTNTHNVTPISSKFWMQICFFLSSPSTWFSINQTCASPEDSPGCRKRAADEQKRRRNSPAA